MSVKDDARNPRECGRMAWIRTDGKQLDIVWQGWIALVLVTMIQSAIQTSQSADMNKFAPPFFAWVAWFIAEFVIGLPLNVWWVISVKSLARQCKEGGPAIGSAEPASAAVATSAAVPVAVATAVPVANPVNKTEAED